MNIEKLSKKISELEKRIEVLENLNHKPDFTDSYTPQAVKQISAKEFLLSKNLSSALEKTLALGYYMEHIMGVSSFNIKDIANSFQAAREKIPANLNDMINKNIVKGYLMEAQERKDAKKAWVLTTTGEKVVDNNPKINN